MDAILYIMHGSRVAKGVEQAASFIQRCMQNIDVPIQEYCFLELANPNIKEAFQRCIERGATKIHALPVLLLTAAHAKDDIPTELSRIHKQYPEVGVRYGRPIGVDSNMVDILVERIQETGEAITEDSMVLLVGRGSSDPDVKRDLIQIGELLHQRIGVNRIVDCYLTAASPSFEEGLHMAKESGLKRVFVIPYLLFTGILMKTMEKEIEKLEAENQFILCSYLGYHPLIEKVLQDRVKEMLEG
ncbi:sirohydrochlorin chelatase [Peribacillus saganii]|uniref:Sirohydrochlorin chelatase n=1 Tax=Peribacillus saganii TaxID=2303992 RepID=A0A372LLC8_9BACI|nr:sirohydrochlorin chelatase [Peribacillus saganii]RFU67643.1 sirohydrochlorin chelatase [Peribacillus saganii]